MSTPKTEPLEAWERTLDLRQFCDVCLAAQISLRPGEVYALATRLMNDPLIESRYMAKYQAWWASQPFADLDPKNPSDDIHFRDHHELYMEVAHELSRAEKIELRKRYVAQ